MKHYKKKKCLKIISTFISSNKDESVCVCVGVCVWVWPIYRTYRTSITQNFGRGPGLKHANGKIKMLTR